MCQFAQIALPRAILKSAIEIKRFPSCIIECWRVHVTRLAHGDAVSVRQAFRNVAEPLGRDNPAADRRMRGEKKCASE